MPPMISFICPTYGRYPDRGHLLQEKVYWFLQQKGCIPGQDTELIILNDAKEQHLTCESPGVRVVNTQFRFSTLGDKYNALLALARGDIICTDEDDDISLPLRAAASSDALVGYDLWNPQKTWFESGGKEPYADTHGVDHNTSAYRKGLFCYRPNNQQDLWADMDAKAVGRVAPPGNIRVYVYRWGVSDFHCSGRGGILSDKKVTPGRFEIVPKMAKDYNVLG